MIVWLASYPRSGNTLLRTVLNRAFQTRTYSLYDDPSDLGINPKAADFVGHINHGMKPDEFIQAYSSSPDTVFAKTHGLPDDDRKAIYVVRDGRASIVSYYHYTRDIPKRECSVEGLVIGGVWPGLWSEHVRQWAFSHRPNTLVVRYEKLALGDPETLSRIGDFLGIQQKKDVDFDFETSRSVYPEFFRGGSNERNVRELEELCPNLFYALHGEMMATAGYETRKPDPVLLASEIKHLLDGR